MKNVFLTIVSLVFLSSFSMAVDKAQMQADRDAVKSACTAEATQAGCAGQEVGKGLLKCMGTYKKANKDFKMSEGCKSAMQKLKSDRQSRKAEREAKKATK